MLLLPALTCGDAYGVLCTPLHDSLKKCEGEFVFYRTLCGDAYGVLCTPLHDKGRDECSV